MDVNQLKQSVRYILIGSRKSVAPHGLSTLTKLLHTRYAKSLTTFGCKSWYYTPSISDLLRTLTGPKQSEPLNTRSCLHISDYVVTKCCYPYLGDRSFALQTSRLTHRIKQSNYKLVSARKLHFHAQHIYKQVPPCVCLLLGRIPHMAYDTWLLGICIANTKPRDRHEQ